MKRVICVLLSTVALNASPVGHEIELARRFSAVIGALAGGAIGLRDGYSSQRVRIESSKEPSQASNYRLFVDYFIISFTAMALTPRRLACAVTYLPSMTVGEVTGRVLADLTVRVESKH